MKKVFLSGIGDGGIRIEKDKAYILAGFEVIIEPMVQKNKQLREMFPLRLGNVRVGRAVYMKKDGTFHYW